MPDNTVKYTWEQLVDACYTEQSLVQYRSRLRCLDALGCRANYAGLARRVRLAQKIAYSTFTQTVNAVQWDRRRQDKVLMTAEQMAALAFVARGRRETVDVPRARGAITYDLFCALLARLKGIGTCQGLCWGLKMCFSTGLRNSEMKLLRRSQFHVDASGDWILTAEKKHDPHRIKRAGGKALIIKRSVFKKAKSEMDRRMLTMAPDALVCPAWDGLRANQLIQESAAALKWDARLVWDGVHCLRHGVGATACAERGVTADAREILGHSQDAGSERYAQANPSRVHMVELKLCKQKSRAQREAIAAAAAGKRRGR
jgi:integrase